MLFRSLAAAGEILRVLAAGGAALVTVPYGRAEDHGWFRQYGREHWQRLLGALRAGGRVSEHYFRHRGRAGWGEVEADALRDSGYRDEANSGAAGLAVAYVEKPRGGRAG